MRQFTSVLSAALVALWLVPQTMTADCAFTTNLFPGQAADRTETTVNATVHVGEFGYGSTRNKLDPFTSSNTDAVMIYSRDGYSPYVYFVGVGTADVNYTEKVTRPEECSTTHKIKYTVEKGTPTACFRAEDNVPFTELNVTLGGGGSSGDMVMPACHNVTVKELNTSAAPYQFYDNPIAASNLTFNSTNTAVATIDADGKVTAKAVGTSVISVSWPGNTNWNAANASYTLHVRAIPTLSFTPATVNAELGATFTPPTLNKPDGVTVSSWSSNNTAVAEINASTGEVTLKGVGQAIITCTSAQNDSYVSRTATYTINVTSLGLKVRGVYVTSENADDILGDGKVRFVNDPNEPTLHLNAWNIDVTALDNAAKSGVISYTGNEFNSLMIILHGNCSITGANICILSPNRPLTIRSESKHDTLTLVADANSSSRAVKGVAVKMHEALFFATGNEVGLDVNDLIVTKYGHVFAQGTNASNGVATTATNFTKGEGGIGGIDILTPGVHWVNGGTKEKRGFFSDPENTIRAKLVEIGKVPLPIENNVQTTIEFTITDPEGHDNIVFSNSASDTFNEEKKQIEITSHFTDEQVTNALETLVPGSSAWVLGLPGSIIFDIPAGEGDVELEMTMEPGYEFKFIIGDATAVSVAPNEKGIAVMHYNVLVQTHVILYLQYKGGSPAPKRAAKAEKDATPNATVKSIVITPKGVAAGIDAAELNETGTHKMLLNGQLLILRGDKLYTITGQEVK